MFADFACVKCVKSGQQYVSKLSCEDYAKGSGKRKKTVRHYIGFAVKAEDRLLGFVNIEFHNETIFNAQEDLDDYAEQQLMAFKYLIEYQFLKALFFQTLHQHLTDKKH